MVRRFLKPVAAFLTELGGVFSTFLSVLYWTVRPPFRVGLFMNSLRFVGAGSLFIILLTGTFTGAVFAMQTIYAFSIIGAKSMVGGTVALALSRELAPVLTALMVTGRVGSAMATEIGTMRVTEQIDALETMAVHPVQYLMVPRVWASTIMVPVLSILFSLVGMAGCYLVSVTWMGVDRGQFIDKTASFMEVSDLVNGLVKAVVFGAALATIACYKGFRAEGGARGVGQATTQAVVLSSVSVFVLDYIMTTMMF